MKTQIRWRGGAAFTAQTGSGHTIEMDGPPEHGGANTAARPMEAFLSAAAACSAFDVIHILQKGRQPARDLVVQVEGKRADAEPKVYTEIDLQFIVSGDGVSEAAVARATRLSVEKYCSALVMLAAAGCKITHSYRLNQG